MRTYSPSSPMFSYDSVKISCTRAVVSQKDLGITSQPVTLDPGRVKWWSPQQAGQWKMKVLKCS